MDEGVGMEKPGHRSFSLESFERRIQRTTGLWRDGDRARASACWLSAIISSASSKNGLANERIANGRGVLLVTNVFLEHKAFQLARRTLSWAWVTFVDVVDEVWMLLKSPSRRIVSESRRRCGNHMLKLRFIVEELNRRNTSSLETDDAEAPCVYPTDEISPSATVDLAEVEVEQLADVFLKRIRNLHAMRSLRENVREPGYAHWIATRPMELRDSLRVFGGALAETTVRYVVSYLRQKANHDERIAEDAFDMRVLKEMDSHELGSWFETSLENVSRNITIDVPMFEGVEVGLRDLKKYAMVVSRGEKLHRIVMPLCSEPTRFTRMVQEQSKFLDVRSDIVPGMAEKIFCLRMRDIKLRETNHALGFAYGHLRQELLFEMGEVNFLLHKLYGKLDAEPSSYEDMCNASLALKRAKRCMSCFHAFTKNWVTSSGDIVPHTPPELLKPVLLSLFYMAMLQLSDKRLVPAVNYAEYFERFCDLHPEYRRTMERQLDLLHVRRTILSVASLNREQFE